MLIERLTVPDGILCIGISEHMNPRGLGIDELLNIANSLSNTVKALQFFNSFIIVDEMHLISAAQNAVNALSGGYMISRNLEVEIAVYASAQHQIGRALEIVGVEDGLGTITVVCIDEDEEKVRQCVKAMVDRIGMEVFPILEPSSEKISYLMKQFGITELEIQQFTNSDDIEERNKALSKCVVSRVSQVSVNS